MIYRYEVMIDNTSNLVSLNVVTTNDKGLLEYEGKKITKLRTWLESQTGAFGHILGIATTPIDLDYAINQNCPWEVTQLSGEVFNYNSGLSSNQLS